MAGRVITITSGKGGVGKTTAVANLAAALALQGKRVVAIDADVGLRNLDVVMGLENRIVYDLVDVAEGQCRLRQALIRDKRLTELYLLPAAQTRNKSDVTPEDMKRIGAQLKEEFDFVLVDSPAGIEQGFRNALAPADEFIVITTPDVSAVRDADRVIGLLEAEDRGEPHLVINRLKPQMVRRGDMMSVADVLEILSVSLLGIVPEDEFIVVSTNRGEPAVLSGKTMASRAYVNIAKRLLGYDVPFMAVEEDGSVVDRLLRFIRQRDVDRQVRK
jgi:septum site-determining protein MinD